MNNHNVSDDQIITEAERIKLNARERARLNAFETSRGLMIRWDNGSGNAAGENYTSIAVTHDDVREIVRRKLTESIEARPAPDWR